MKAKYFSIPGFQELWIFTAILASTIFFISRVDAQQPVATTPQLIYAISGNADAHQLVPAGAGNGAGTITGTYDPATHVLDYTSTWERLTGAPSTGAFYHGASGANGKIVGEPWSFGTNVSPSGNTSGKITLTDSQAKDLLEGNWYYSYNTSANVNGEVRGQINARKQ